MAGDLLKRIIFMNKFLVFSLLIFAGIMQASNPAPEGHIDISQYDTAKVYWALQRVTVEKKDIGESKFPSKGDYFIAKAWSLRAVNNNTFDPSPFDDLYGPGEARKAIDKIEKRK